MKKPTPLPLPKDRRAEIRLALQAYFLDELEMELSDLQADLFLDFLATTIGNHFYNLGVTDTIAAIKDKASDLVLLLRD